MKKIISLMLAVTMICASIGLTAFAATTTTVEAEADGVFFESCLLFCTSFLRPLAA